MQINILNSDKNIISVTPKGRFLIELLQKENAGTVVSVFNPLNRKEEVLINEQEISSVAEVQNAIWKSGDYYFVTTDNYQDDDFGVTIHKYSSHTRTCDVFYRFEATGLHETNKRLKIFVLSANVLFIQTETVVSEIVESLMGGLRFDQRIVDIDSDTEIEIKDENIKNNGINLIIPVSPTQIITKTGYSYIEDKRLATGSEESALLESIYLHTTSRFIADLTIQAPTIDSDLIESAYYDKYIVMPSLEGNYLYYTIVTPSDESSESVFLNLDIREKVTCKNDYIDYDDLKAGYVIKDTPYVKNTAMIETRLLNLRSMEFDISSMGMELIDILGELIILRRYRKKDKAEIIFYHYPDMNLLHTEKGEYLTGIKKNDKYYIYIQK